MTLPPEALWRSACRKIDGLQQRRQELGSGLFYDAAWVILLHLYCAEAEGRCDDLAELSARSGIRSEAAQRWLQVLKERGLVEACGRASSIVALTENGMRRIEKLLTGEPGSETCGSDLSDRS